MCAQASKVSVLPPRGSEEDNPLFLLWGTFSGQRENLAGAVYLEIRPEEQSFRGFSLSLFNNEEEISDFNTAAKPLSFQQDVQAKSGVHGDVTHSTEKLVKDSFKEFFFGEDNFSRLGEILRRQEEQEFKSLVGELLSRVIRKGTKSFNVNGQSLPPGALEKGTNGKIKEQDSEDLREKSKNREAEKDVNYHRISIVTIPLKGIEPTDLVPGDEIYVRVVGELSEQFPDELQSERHDKATKPIEAAVESVEIDPKLPGDFDGQSDDYVEVKVNIPGNFHGNGFVYKKETVKPVGELKKDEDGLDIFLISSIFFGLGMIFILLAIAAYYIFG